jgi:streptogramin lyase
MKRTLVVALLFFYLGEALAQSGAALTGVISSDAEGPMEGVLVSAKKIGGTITVTVVTNKQGQYAFPSERLGPGKYKVTTRATGYDAPDPAKTVTVSTHPTVLNITIGKTKDLASQLSWAEWLMSVPGTPAQKDSFYACVGCHSAQTITRSKDDAASWPSVLVSMRNQGPASTPTHPVLLPYQSGPRPTDATFGQYLSSINLSNGKTTWTYALKTLPRPTGKATKVIVTEYDLTRSDALPGDAVVDADGMVWYVDFATGALGRLNPSTGAVKEWELPVMKPGFPLGALGLELDADGNPWIARVFQAGVTKFDKKTEKLTNYKIPDEYNNVRTRTAMLAIDREGIVWFDDPHNRRMFQLNPSTGRMIAYAAYPNWKTPDWSVEPDPGLGGRAPGDHGHFMYGVDVDSKGAGYWADLSGGNIGKMDGVTGKVTLYAAPTPNSGPRRIHMDSDDQLWYGANYALKIGMFDTKTLQFREWEDPTPWDAPYDAVRDKAGYVWAAGWTTGFVTRLNPMNGEIVQYLLPGFNSEIRRVSVDNKPAHPVFWAGENAEPRIVKVEPLD